MKKLMTAAFWLLTLAVAFTPSLSYGGVSVDIGVFYDNLAPHGEWIQMETYGWVWTPRHVSADWRPYSRGHWVLTDEDGWLWVSDEEWGWATCHYGRWFFDQDRGWVWVPGLEWAPAWVSWRTGGGYIGWAPLPPQFTWSAAVGFRAGNASLDAVISPRHYLFVTEGQFLYPAVQRRALPVAQNVAIINVTRNVTDYGVVHSRPFNRGVDVGGLERTVHHAVPRVRLVDAASQQQAGRRVSSEGRTIPVFRPTVRRVAGLTPARSRAQTSVAGHVVKPRPVEPPAQPRASRRDEQRVTERRSGQQPQVPQRQEARSRQERQSQEAKAREARAAQKRQGAQAREQAKVEERQRPLQVPTREARAKAKQQQEHELSQARQERQAQAVRAKNAQETLGRQQAQAREQQTVAQKERQLRERDQLERTKQQQAQALSRNRQAQQAREANAGNERDKLQRQQAQVRERQQVAERQRQVQDRTQKARPQQEEQRRRAQVQARKKPEPTPSTSGDSSSGKGGDR